MGRPRACAWFPTRGGNDIGFGPIELPEPVTSAQFCLGVLAGDPEPSWGFEIAGDVVTVEHGDTRATAQHVLCSDPTPMG